MNIDWMDIAISLLSAGLFALVGFVWRFSHKVTSIEKFKATNSKNGI